MARAIILFLLLIQLTSINVQTHEEEGHITAEISDKGLNFLKNLLVQKAESSLVPLELQDIEKSAKIPVIGRVKMVLSNIVIEEIHVTDSTARTEEGSGIVVEVSGATASLSMDWKYSYKTWIVTISDKGTATVQVEGLEVGLTLGLKTVEGSLKLSVLQCGCSVSDISIELDGGASWLYQGLVDVFEGKIGSAVETAIAKKIKDRIVKLDSRLQSIPKEVLLTNVAALNVTFVGDPELSESSLKLAINGLISAKDEAALSTEYPRSLQHSSSRDEADKMIIISFNEDVLKSASSVYFEAGKMHWIVDKVPDQYLLNTAAWRFIIPQLYKMYPDCDMNLNISVSSPPVIKVEKQHIKATVPLDVVIDVLEGQEVVPVVCITMVITSGVSAQISGSALTGIMKLNDFNMSLNWSEIGGLHMNLIQTLMSTTLRSVILPYINLKLSQGFQLPAFHGYGLQHAQILCTDSWIVTRSDIESVKQLKSSI